MYTMASHHLQLVLMTQAKRVKDICIQNIEKVLLGPLAVEVE